MYESIRSCRIVVFVMETTTPKPNQLPTTCCAQRWPTGRLERCGERAVIGTAQCPKHSKREEAMPTTTKPEGAG